MTLGGHDAATGSTATSPGPAGTTGGPNIIDWTVGYRNLTGASAGVDIMDAITSNHAFVPGSLKVPPGISPRFSRNGGATFTAIEPATGVNAVGAAGISDSGSTATESTPFLPPPVSFTGATGGGDGYEAIFFGANIYNVHHHASGAAQRLIECHVKATGALCPGYPASGVSPVPTPGTPLSTATSPYVTTAQTFSGFNQETGTIYAPVGINGTKEVGLACVDLSTDTSCGFIQIGTGFFNNDTATGGRPQIGAVGQIGTKLYAVGDQAQVYCYDYAAVSLNATEVPAHTASDRVRVLGVTARGGGVTG